MSPAEFRDFVWGKAGELYRPMPWRDEPTLYYVIVSEIMLQQTQVARCLIKFEEFIRAFPNFSALAEASLGDVLRQWQGLGYNRRAKYLHQAAKTIVRDGEPRTFEALTQLPGIGRNTAGAIMNYVYQVPTPFVETNIRTVYIHHFFTGEQSVSDRDILARVHETLDIEHPREFCWALMDYGAYLKSRSTGRLDQSRHYRKQAPLKGSLREMRGVIIKALTRSAMSKNQLEQAVDADDRFATALADLECEGLISRTGQLFHLTK